jgi:hypothetical protein
LNLHKYITETTRSYNSDLKMSKIDITEIEIKSNPICKCKEYNIMVLHKTGLYLLDLSGNFLYWVDKSSSAQESWYRLLSFKATDCKQISKTMCIFKNFIVRVQIRYTIENPIYKGCKPNYKVCVGDKLYTVNGYRRSFRTDTVSDDPDEEIDHKYSEVSVIWKSCQSCIKKEVSVALQEIPFDIMNLILNYI